MFEVGDKVLHLESFQVGTVIKVHTKLDDFTVEVDFISESDFHSHIGSYSIDGKVWIEDEKPTIVPATKLHRLLYGIED